MSEPITPKQFHELEWRIVRDAASTHFRTRSFAAGVALVDAIGALADAGNHHPDVDLRSDGVTVRLQKDSEGRLSEDDLALAREISEAARQRGVAIDLTGLQAVQIAIDALVIPDVLPFWRAVLGYEQVADEDLADPHFEGPPFWFQQMDAPRPQRNRIHLDITVSHDEGAARVRAALDAGGRLVSDSAARAFWVLADAEGNEVCVCTWQDRD
jgi:4a-hydroxytetrahydrobiopterin dehydratase